MAADLFSLTSPDRYIVIGLNMTPPEWLPGIYGWVAVPLGMLVLARDDILDVTKDNTGADPTFPGPMQANANLIIFEGPDARFDIEPQLASYEGWMGDRETAIMTNGFTLRQVAEQLMDFEITGRYIRRHI